MKRLVTYCFLLTVLIFRAQPTVQSVIHDYRKATDDSSRCSHLLWLSENAPEPEWQQYNGTLRKISFIQLTNNKNTQNQKKLYAHYYLKSISNLGYDLFNKGKISKAKLMDSLCLNMAIAIADEEIQSASLNNLGFIYDNLGDNKRALHYYERSLDLATQLHDTAGMGNMLNNIGMLNYNAGDDEKAITQLNQSLDLRKRIGDVQGMGFCYNSLGTVYGHLGQNEKSLYYHRMSYELRKKSEEIDLLAISLTHLGQALSKLQKTDSALQFFNQALEIYRKTENPDGMSLMLNQLSDIYIGRKEFEKAEKTARESMELANELGFPDAIRKSAFTMKKISEYKNDYKAALQYTELYIKMRDSLTGMEHRKSLVREILKQDYEKKAAADSVKTVEEKKVVHAQLKQEQVQRYSLLVGLLLVVVFALFMVNRFRVTNRQKKLIEEQKVIVEAQKYVVEEKQREILDSIRYARRIQTALITNEHYIHQKLKRLKR